MSLKPLFVSTATIKKYGVIEEKCSKGLSTLIRKYIIENSIKVGDYLFGDKKLSQYVSPNNLKVGVKGGTNVFRHMKITDELKTIKSPEERIKLAESMKHSPMVQLKYVRRHL
jgi:hypothetical protein